MVGGVQEKDVIQDIKDAKSIGLDGFALNYDQFEWWSNDTVNFMFNHADELGDFSLFFSFDHGKGILKDPLDYATYFTTYSGRSSYLKMKDRNGNARKPVLSTFGGEKIGNDRWNEFKKTVGDVLIIPGFSEVYNPTTNFFQGRSAIDGVFNWNSWPTVEEGRVTVSAAVDRTFQTAARNANKYFMMGISPLQFKHTSYGNWYRRGEDNLENRIGQILNVQPDMVQLQTWNDGGESHYMGRLHPEPLDDRTKALTDGYDHTGYWQILPSFINAWKRGDTSTANMYPTNGKPVQGTFWHHTLTIGGSCYADEIAKTNTITTGGEDAVSGVLLVAQNKQGLKAEVKVGNARLGNVISLSPGFNKFKLTGLENLVPGKVQVEVWDGSTMVGGGYGSIEVTRQKALCNYNFQVVGLPS
ncbi:glycoside hydrolase [Bipolaris maydis]|nr:glycoside hydrolase [Bipolaris maydis]